MDGERHGPRGLFGGCNSIGQKIFARASSSESLEEGPRATRLAWTPVPAGATGPRKRFPKLTSPGGLFNRYKQYRNRDKGKDPGMNTVRGVLIPVMENMWGVLIFLRFYYIVGNAGIWQTYIVVLVSFACAFITTMSLSAVATNGPIEEGGTYYLISRALGPKLGGTVGIMYYLGVSLLAVLESLGAVEMLGFTFHQLDFVSANRVLGASIIVFLAFLVYFGMGFVSKLSMLFFLIVIYTMASYYIGMFIAPKWHRHRHPDNLTGLKWSTFKGNWNSGYEKGVSFPVALAIFFPCYTGILSGADRAKNLARPERSIPRGTIGAITISLVMYLSYMGLWGAVGTRDYLLGRAADGTKRSDGQNLEVVKDVAWPLPIITQLGIIVASMAQALQCLVTSPRLLQAIANDGVIPVLAPLAKTSKTGEPTRALGVTAILCVAAAMIGSLDAVAPLVSICFLTAYAALNASCFVLDLAKSPSWRPKWKFYHWTVAAAGCLLCIALSFVIKWYWALACVVIQGILFGYIDYRQVEVDWGTGLGGLRLHLAVQSILAFAHEARYTVNWRPQLLLLLKPRSAMGPDDHNNEELMLLGSQLKKGRGLCVIATILEGIMQKMASQVEAERLELENAMQKLNVQGFVRVLVASNYREGKSFAIQSSGLGALEPNTLLLGWPNEWHQEGHYHNAEVMLEILDQCKAANKSSILCMNLKEFPHEKAQEEGYIDVWWMVHDGGMLILLAHLLKQHRIWRKCKLRVHTISDQMHDTVSVEKNLRGTLNKNRIEAEVKVFDMATGGLAPYTYDTTIRLQEARDFARQVAEYRLGKEQQERPEMSRQASIRPQRKERPEMSRQDSIKPQRKESSGMQSEDVELAKSPTIRASPSGDRPTLDNVFRGRESDAQTSQSKEPFNSRGEHFDDQTGSSTKDHQSTAPKNGRSSFEHQEEPDLAKYGHSKRKLTSPAQIGRRVEHILKKSVPGELSMLEGKEYKPRSSRGPLQALKTHITGGHVDREGDSPSPRTSMAVQASASKDGESQKHDISGDAVFQSRLTSTESTSSTPPTETDLPSATTSRTVKGEAGENLRIGEDSSLKRSGPLSGSESADISRGKAATGPVVENLPADSSAEQRAATAEPNNPRGGKETRWAITIPHETEPEITVEGNTNDKKEIAEDGGIHVMVRKDSAGQIYPGSPHHSEFSGVSATIDMPEVVKRTWETFSQDYSPDELNEKILEQSKDAQLVLLNLPDHYEGMEPAVYMEYCEKLTKGLRRVLLVSGTGKELWRGETAQ